MKTGVVIRPLGSLKQYIGGQSEVMVESGGRVRQVLEQLGIPPPVVALVLVNDVPRDKEYVLQDGDQVRLLAVIGGG